MIDSPVRPMQRNSSQDHLTQSFRPGGGAQAAPSLSLRPGGAASGAMLPRSGPNPTYVLILECRLCCTCHAVLQPSLLHASYGCVYKACIPGFLLLPFATRLSTCMSDVAGCLEFSKQRLYSSLAWYTSFVLGMCSTCLLVIEGLIWGCRDNRGGAASRTPAAEPDRAPAASAPAQPPPPAAKKLSREELENKVRGTLEEYFSTRDKAELSETIKVRHLTCVCLA